jgi:hypothetical protein
MKQVAIIIFGLFVLSAQAIAHPLKMAYTAVKYLPEKKCFEISHRVFQDDFEATLQNGYGYRGDVFTKQNELNTRKAVDGFFEKNFYILFNGQRLRNKYIRTEQKHDMGIIVYYETQTIAVANIKSVEVFNFIMMESFKEQVNMFNLKINSTVNSTRKFEIKKTREYLKL